MRDEAVPALADLDQALVLADPSRAGQLYFARARVHEGLGDPEAAVGDYGEALASAPLNVDAWRSRAGLHRAARRYDEAISDYTRVIELAPEDTESLYARAGLYRKIGASHLAIKDYNQVLEQQPGSPKAHAQRGYL